MRLTLAYGREGLEIDLPDRTKVIESGFVPEVGDEETALIEALRAPIDSRPLRQKVNSGDTVMVVHTDITRATPNDRILPVLLAELEDAGVRREDITLMNALGTHRAQTAAELREILGEDIVERYRCLQHDAFSDSDLTPIGKTSHGHPVRINRRFLQADVRILTGLIEPHFFAGFSGGPKGVLPALAGAESVRTNHGHDMIAHPGATWGVTYGNPIWEEMREVARWTEPTFLLNVTLNAKRKITGVFAGDFLSAHAAGCDFVRTHAMAAVDELFDIVVTTGGGYPLDQNLYQSVKGMSVANQILREGGSIVLAAACEDGLPDHGRYARLLKKAGSPNGVLSMIAKPGFSEQDQWQVQIQAAIQQRADVYVYSDGLTDEEIERALLIPCGDITGTVRRLLRSNSRGDSRIAVIPEGPRTIVYLGA